MRSLLEQDGIDCSGVATDAEARSGVAMIVVDAQGENTVLAVYGANARCGKAGRAALDRALGQDAEGSVLLVQQEIPLETSAAGMRLARERGARVILDPAPAWDSLPDGFRGLCDILTPNQGEAEALTGLSAADPNAAVETAAALAPMGIPEPIVTLGANGVVAVAEQSPIRILGHPVGPVASVGAGDAFNGALAVGLAEGRALAEAAAFANAAAALSVTKAGVQESMPDRETAEAILRDE